MIIIIVHDLETIMYVFTKLIFKPKQHFNVKDTKIRYIGSFAAIYN